jgi:osmotically inducible protein OsmC
MPIAERTASVVWEGSLARGSGTLASGSGAFAQLPVTWAARTEAPGGKTSPEELLAAAHATCYPRALALVLGEASTPPERLGADATCTFDEVDGAPRITRIALSVRGRVDGLDERGFKEAVGRAAALCPVSNALRGNVDISIDAILDAA